MTESIEKTSTLPEVVCPLSADLDKLKEKWAIIPDCEDKASYEIVKKGISELVKYRTAAKKWHKDTKAEALEFGRNCDKVKNLFLDEISEMENRCRAAKALVDDRKAREAKEKLQAETLRIGAIREKITYLQSQTNCADMNSEQVRELIGRVRETAITGDIFEEFASEANAVQGDVLDKLEDCFERVKAREEQVAAETAERIRVVNEQAREAVRLKEEREAFQAEREAEEAKQAEERARIAKEQALENDRLRAEREELARERAAEERERTARRKADEAILEQARKDREQRQLEERETLRLERVELELKQAEIDEAKRLQAEKAAAEARAKADRESETINAAVQAERKNEIDQVISELDHNELLDALINDEVPYMEYMG